MHWGHCWAAPGAMHRGHCPFPPGPSWPPPPSASDGIGLGPTPATNLASLGLPLRDPPTHERLNPHFINHHPRMKLPAL